MSHDALAVAFIEHRLMQVEIDDEVARAALSMGQKTPDGKPDVQKWLTAVQQEQGLSLETYIRDSVEPSVALKKLAGDVQVTNDDLQKGYEANYGKREDFTVAGVPVGREITDLLREKKPTPPDGRQGSIIVVVATDAPLVPHQLKRLARRVPLGIGRVGGVGNNGSGDLFLAFSAANPGADHGARASADRFADRGTRGATDRAAHHRPGLAFTRGAHGAADRSADCAANDRAVLLVNGLTDSRTGGRAQPASERRGGVIGSRAGGDETYSQHCQNPLHAVNRFH